MQKMVMLRNGRICVGRNVGTFTEAVSMLNGALGAGVYAAPTSVSLAVIDNLNALLGASKSLVEVYERLIKKHALLDDDGKPVTELKVVAGDERNVMVFKTEADEAAFLSSNQSMLNESQSLKLHMVTADQLDQVQPNIPFSWLQQLSPMIARDE